MKDEQMTFESRYSQPEPPGAPYAHGSDTSYAAAKRVSSRAAEQQAKVYAAIVAAGAEGMTWDEISVALDLAYTANGRVTELRDTGRIVDSGVRRNTRRNCPATVWIAAPAKKAEVA